jgi:hypothetical protein
MIVLGFESYLVCQQQVDALKSVIKLNSILDKLIGRVILRIGNFDDSHLIEHLDSELC